MRGLRRRRSAPTLEFAIPTINIVFLMLLFFIFTGSQANRAELSVAPPQAALLPPDRLPRPLLTIDPAGALFLDGAPVAEADLSAAVGRLRQAGGGGMERLAILAERSLPAHRLLALVRSLRAADGLSDLAIVVVTDRPRAAVPDPAR